VRVLHIIVLCLFIVVSSGLGFLATPRRLLHRDGASEAWRTPLPGA